MLTQEFKAEWTTKMKIVFRFIFAYFSLYIFLMFVGGLFETPFKWIGKNIFNFSYNFEVSGNGSGDNTYAYISLFVGIIATIIITIAWSILDSKRKSYNKAFYWFLKILRIFIIMAMLLYGFVKVFQIQFPYPSLTRMLEPLGNFSPMGLAWTYMGYSKGFNLFTGSLEIIGGLLLIPRRTQTLGSFLVMGIMTHVAVMNFMFDIPVKILSVHLVLMSAVIFMTDYRRFVNVFFKNRPVEQYEYYDPVNERGFDKIVFWVKSIGLALLIIIGCIFGYSTEKSNGTKREKPYLYGMWEAKTFIKNNDTLPPLITDDYRWHYLIVDYKGRATIKTMTNNKLYYTFEPDTTASKIKMYLKDNELDISNYQYSYPNYSQLELEGFNNNDTLKIIFKRKDLDDFLLHSRGFHWINESPLNK
ncbi:hypothetical protein GGR42_001490 [Saonia flava]|uniref:DoxX family protein n=1 Tax=Saonia flava TaxID=523696 RepID=A0A846QSJ4_9FLAO|nr:hypothetical protein [Saonia flava]NJB71028.1 hypothetical protein [Saonia flava]